MSRIVEALAPDILQLHGCESPARVKEIGARFACATMKAVGVAAPEDLAAVRSLRRRRDFLLIDAKPPEAAPRYPAATAFLSTGGSRVISVRGRPWLLSGGLDAANVAEAIALTDARGVDVSSGVESAPGLKDEAKIEAFVAAARRALARATEGVH